ncbi:MAG: tetratricopeptide repeat protein [Caulobacteraceae bacterium]
MNSGHRALLLVLAAAIAGAPLAASALGPGGDAVPAHPYNGYDANEAYHDGLQRLDNHQFHLAEEDFRKILADKPNQPIALYYLGEAEEGLGDLRGAAVAWETSLWADPTQYGLARDLALLDVKLGRAGKAKKILVKLEKDAAACGDSCPEAGYLETAIEAVKAALAGPTATASSAKPAS